jgi:hypothetical protein
MLLEFSKIWILLEIFKNPFELFETFFYTQGWFGHCGNASTATRLFFRVCEAFLKNAWHFKDIFREFDLFYKISILFEAIVREIEAFFN